MYIELNGVIMKRRKMSGQRVAGVVRTVSALGAGFLAGVLAVFVALYSIGAFSVDARPITVRPVIDLRTPTVTPRPTSTPQPTSTPTDEEAQEERDKWRSIMLPTPYMEAEKIAALPTVHITTGKKERKERRKARRPHKITDENEDGILEARISLVDIDGTLVGLMSHQCCACASTHRVSFRLIFNGYGLPVLLQRWAVDDEATHQNRRQQFGPDYWKPTMPGEGLGTREIGTDRWER